MYTQCPLCNTQYLIIAAELKAALGKVRCAHCDSAFNALSRLSDTPLETAAAPSASLLAADSMAGDETGASPAAVISASMAPTGPMISDLIDTPPRIMMEEFACPRRRPYRALGTALWSMGIVFLLALLLAQYAYATRDNLARSPALRPLVEQLCTLVEMFAHCAMPLRRNLTQIELQGQYVRPHPHFQNTLLVSVTLLNKAPFAQPYPALELTLADFNGALVGHRRFQPADYLLPDVDIGRGMAPQTVTTVRLDMVTPSASANPDLISWSFALF
ncbi:MAG: zinc-ribbon and DUF3426 domain-containing protein [Gammaproteobacteria bacterium]|nr:zinc-ribbon and DUF3426 domain-containing protein [Gammaproteobacteria bacterium]